MSLLGTRRPVPPGLPSPDESRLVQFDEGNRKLTFTDAVGEHEHTCSFQELTNPGVPRHGPLLERQRLIRGDGVGVGQSASGATR